MKIDFKFLIQEYNQKHGFKHGRSPLDKGLSKSSLAREMVTMGLFKSFQSCLNMIYFHEHGKAKSIDLIMLEYLSKKFGKDYNELIN